MKYNKLALLLFTVLSVAFVSCDKNDDDDTTPGNGNNNGVDTTTYDPGKVLIDFSNMGNTHDLDQTGGTTYQNALGQPFKVTKFRYYVSNIVLVKEDGTEHTVPDIYQLIDEDSTATRKITCNGVPGGKYASMRFMVGVDAARVAAGNFSGYLDPARGMYWNSTDGFAALELEGLSAASPSGNYTYKIGGLGNNNALKTVTISFNGQKLIVDGTRNATLHIFSEILELFRQPLNLDISSTNSVTTPGSAAMVVADNYADMWRFDHMHN